MMPPENQFYREGGVNSRKYVLRQHQDVKYESLACLFLNFITVEKHFFALDSSRKVTQKNSLTILKNVII